MKWFNKLERKYGKYAISNLMYYIIGLYVVGFILNLFAPQFYTEYLDLSVAKILQGQVWRLVTYIIEPPSTSLIFAVFTLYFYYLIGTNLENTWGSFKFNVYYFSGVILHIVAAFLIYFIFGYDFSMTTYYINLALFMAFAVEYGEMQVLLFFIIPIKIKWLAYLDGAIFAITIIGGFLAYPMITYMPNLYVGLMRAGIPLNPVIATCALVSMINFLIFLFIFRKGGVKSQTQKNYNKAMKAAMKNEKANGSYVNGESRSEKKEKMIFKGATRHKCAVCGRTENDGDLTFRYCSKCKGDYEYCQDHLYTHIHVGSKEQ